MSQILAPQRHVFARIDMRWYAVLISLLLSILLIATRGVINSDGILYLRSAEAFIAHDWKAAAEVYSWPFYSWLVALVHQALSMQLENAAYLINTLLFALLVYVFITLVRELSASPDAAIFATLIILLLPSLNEYRAFVIRDAGYWACYLAGLMYFLRYLRRPGLASALAWGLAMLLGTLFRIEGMVVMALLPLFVLSNKEESFRTRLRHFRTLNAVLLLCLIGGSLLYIWKSGDIGFTGRLGEPLARLQNFIHVITEGIVSKAEALEGAVLNEYSRDFAVAGVVSILLVIIGGKILSGFGLVHLLLTVYGALQSRRLPSHRVAFKLLCWAAIVQLTIIIVFTTGQFFITGRHILAFVLTVLIFAPLGLACLRERWKTRELPTGKMWIYPLLCLLLAVAAIDSTYSFGPSKVHLREAGRWLAGNIPPSSRLLTNDEALAYYAQSIGQVRGEFTDAYVASVLDGTVPGRNYEYVAIVVKRRDLESAESLHKRLADEPLKSFENNRGDRVLIFKRSSAQ